MNIQESFTAISDVGEFGLIERVAGVLGPDLPPDVLAGIGDDAAVYRTGEGRVHVVTTDALIEGIHFDRVFMPMRHLGIKSISVNVSDVLAMNALPRYATLSLGLPHTISVEMVESFYRGVRQAAELYGLTILGGDLTASRRMMISVTVIGEARETEVVYRRGAEPGHALCVTGTLGASYAGLRILLEQRRALQEKGEAFRPDLEAYTFAIQRHLAPTARIEVIRGWRAGGLRPRAMIDVSDGLASEVQHLCRHGGCGALVQAAALPVHTETRQIGEHFGQDADTYALYGGEDYELLFAWPQDDLDRLDPNRVSVIGTFTDAREGIRVRTPQDIEIPLEDRGFQHFGGAGQVE